MVDVEDINDLVRCTNDKDLEHAGQVHIIRLAQEAEVIRFRPRLISRRKMQSS